MCRRKISCKNNTTQTLANPDQELVASNTGSLNCHKCAAHYWHRFYDRLAKGCEQIYSPLQIVQS